MIEVKVQETRMVGNDRRWVKGAGCDGGKGMHEQDGFCAGESNTGAFSAHMLRYQNRLVCIE